MHEYLSWEIGEHERIVIQNESWVALVPYWAVWPFEVVILPRRNVTSLLDLREAEIAAWSACMSEVLIRYDNLFEAPFPYSMGVYQSPLGGPTPDGFIMRQVFLPPLLRSASVRKFMVGYELCAEPQRDITPEMAADRLRQVGSCHYLSVESEPSPSSGLNEGRGGVPH